MAATPDRVRGASAPAPADWRWGLPLVLLATALRLIWVLSVPTVPVGDFAMYRESANYLTEFGHFDPGFIYMPGFVVLLSLVQRLGGELLAQKMIGVFLGGVGAAGVFALTAALFDRDATPRPESHRLRPRSPTAVLATALYALWPSGIAMASVVGTDMPASALILAALGLLATLSRSRPALAAVVFGLAMGLAAYVRAVALPLAGVSFLFWVARRAGLRRAMLLTVLSCATTLLVLLPWGLRNRAVTGEMRVTDHHGGITALIGSNPNSEGTYTRALNAMFKELTGRSVLDQPHSVTDRAAYALVKEFVAFEPRYALGLLLKRAERLFDLERRLLYWPIYREGVLVEPHRGWFDAHHTALTLLSDAFWFTLVASFLLGVAFAWAGRRWSALVILVFQAALAGIYILFFAEPRYRLPIEMLAFPLAAHGLLAVPGALRALKGGQRRAAWPLAVGAQLIALVFLGGVAVVDGGEALRARYRWAATVWSIEGRPGLVMWRRARDEGVGPSPISGAPSGARLRVPDGVSATTAELEAGGPGLPAGRYAVRALVGAATPHGWMRFTIEGADGPADAVTFPRALAPGSRDTRELGGFVRHPGGRLRLRARLERAADATRVEAQVWVSDGVIAPAPAPPKKRR